MVEKEMGWVHVRKRPSAPAIEPAICGAVNVPTITDPWGHFGMAGQGSDDVCKECRRLFRERRQKGQT